MCIKPSHFKNYMFCFSGLSDALNKAVRIFLFSERFFSYGLHRLCWRRTRRAEGLVPKGWPKVLTLVSFMAQRLRRWEGRLWQPRISCNRGRVEPTCRNLVFFENLFKMCSQCVCKMSCLKTDKNEILEVGFFRGHGPTSRTPALVSHENSWLRRW